MRFLDYANINQNYYYNTRKKACLINMNGHLGRVQIRKSAVKVLGTMIVLKDGTIMFYHLPLSKP